MKSAIILGVGPEQGLGAQLCRRFASEGLHVILAGRSREPLEALADDIRRGGDSATAVVADATREIGRAHV